MEKRTLWLIVIVVLIVLLASFIKQSYWAGDSIRVGAILPLSGNFAIYGVEQQRGVDLALEEVENSMKVRYEDSEGDTATAVSAFNKLVRFDDTPIVLTTTSWISNALSTSAKEANVLQGVTISASFFRSGEDNAIRMTLDSKEEMEFVADSLKLYDRIGIMYLNNDLGIGWYNAVKDELGTNVIAAETYLPTDTDFSTQLSKIKSGNVELLLILGTGKDGLLIAKQSRELGLSQQIMGTRAFEIADILEDSATEGLIFPSPSMDKDHEFSNAYFGKHGESASYYGAEAYDFIISLDKAISFCEGEADVECISDWYKNREYSGALGNIRFDEFGDAHYDFVLKEVENGEFVEIEIV
jgi:branched-chain amino acid transport system substrate-binding protein